MLSITPARAATEEHCAARVVGQKPSGEYILSPVTCRSSDAAAVDAVSASTTVGYTTEATTFTIGTHFDGASFTGSSFSVVGSNCSGGWLNLSSTWDNRVSSTLNGCPVITHYDGDNLSGAAEYTFGAGGNLINLNNKTNSIRYSQ
jgi:hypothetical protein